MSEFWCSNWEQKQVGELCDVIDPHPSHRAPKEEPNGIFFLGIGDLKEDGEVIGGKARRVSPEIFDEHQEYYRITDNTIGFCRVASVGKVIEFKSNYPFKITISPTLAIIEPKDIDKRFLAYCLRSRGISDQVASLSSGSTRESLGIKMLRELMVPVPPLPEQRKIAEILSGIDTLIANKERQVRTLTTLQKSVLDALTEDQINSDTPCLELSEVVSPDRKITYGIVQAGPHTPNGVPYIRVTDMARDQLEPNEMMRTTQEVANKFCRSEVREGDVVVALRGIIGASHLIGKRTAGCNLTQGTALLSKSDKCDPCYMNIILKSEYCCKQFALLSKGSTIIEITLSALATLSIPLPSKAEQKRIVRIIDSIQDQIRHGKGLLASYKNLKIAISTDLLSGRKRVSV